MKKAKAIITFMGASVLLCSYGNTEGSNDNPGGKNFRQMILTAKGNDTGSHLEGVKIGAQTWAIANLDVSIYRNGDAIPQVQDATAWSKLTTGAWCYYDNDPANGRKYGKLYNWYAVNDPRGLAPKGWHVPSDAEWTKFIDNSGGGGVAGTKMKNTSGWKDNGNGTNTSSFAGLPGGVRNGNTFPFASIGSYGSWWGSTGGSTTSAWYRCLYYNSVNADRFNGDRKDGMSVRCLKD